MSDYTEYRTQSGDTLASIAWTNYSDHAAIQDILELNPLLIFEPIVLPEDVLIKLPKTAVSENSTLVDHVDVLKLALNPFDLQP